MKSFFKFFFASLLALVVFGILAFFILIGIGISAANGDKPDLKDHSVLVLDLSKTYNDFEQPNVSFNLNFDKLTSQQPSLFDVIRMLNFAKGDSHIRGLYIKASDNINGFATSQELRRAIEDFKTSGKFVVAYGATMAQKAYYVASAANKVYTNPQGGLEWRGMVAQVMFYKGLLDKLDIHPEIFYAGKFKSATEPFRVTQMTEPNRVQTSVWLGDLYASVLTAIGQSRHQDTAQLRALANGGSIQNASDALRYKLVDGLVYHDELLQELHQLLKTSDKSKIEFISIDAYAKVADYKDFSGKDRIAVVYAQGDIADGSNDNKISSDKFVALFQKLRDDDNVKAIVLRVNSPGGSALASDMIWREITLTKKIKPVVVSMGDYAASGGYYISCNGSYIFAEPNTITGSIGVFSVLGNAGDFLKNKLGITFDAVKTGPYADLGTITRPLTLPEQNFMQASVDSIYHTFTERVAAGRHKPVAYIDSIAQGRVWTGMRAVQLGLADSLGSLNDAIRYAAKLANSSSYYLSEYPQSRTIFDQIFNSKKDNNAKETALAKEFGPAVASTWSQWNRLSLMLNVPQARIPFELELK